MVIMNQLTTDKRAAIIRALVEGNSIRATCRMTGAAKGTVTRLLVEVGQACDNYLDRAVRGLTCKRIQCDEIWSFCYAKQKNAADSKRPDEAGDVWTWVALDSDTKLVVTWLMGKRDRNHAMVFMSDLSGRIVNRPQISTDGFAAYKLAVAKAFGDEADFAMVEKYFGSPGTTPETRYSPSVCLGCRKMRRAGNPDPKHISTSHVERQNLTMRMGMRRFTRLTNGFSKKLANMRAALALHYMHYNFCRAHQSLRVTPAMEAGIAGHVWEVEELVSLAA